MTDKLSMRVEMFVSPHVLFFTLKIALHHSPQITRHQIPLTMSRCVFDACAHDVTAYVRVGPGGIRTSWWVQELRTGRNFYTDVRGQGTSFSLQSHSHRDEFPWWWGFCCHGYRHLIDKFLGSVLAMLRCDPDHFLVPPGWLDQLNSPPLLSPTPEALTEAAPAAAATVSRAPASVLAAMRPSPLQRVFPTKRRLLNENHPWPPASRVLLWDRSSGVSSWWRIWQLFMKKKMLSQAHQKHTLGGGKIKKKKKSLRP